MDEGSEIITRLRTPCHDRSYEDCDVDRSDAISEINRLRIYEAAISSLADRVGTPISGRSLARIILASESDKDPVKVTSGIQETVKKFKLEGGE